MTFEEAFDKAVKSFYEGKNFEGLEKSGQKLVYTKDYLDGIGSPKKPVKKVGTGGAAKVDANTSSIKKKKEDIDGSV